MVSYTVRRVVSSLPVLWIVLSLTFIGFRLVPGDPARSMLSQNATPQQVAHLRHQLGLDQPVLTQYWTYMTHAAHLDFGRSFATGRPVFTEIMDRFPNTLELAGSALVLAIILSFLGGISAALWSGTSLGAALTTLAVIGISLPEFWVATMLSLIVSVKLGWLPVAGPGGFEHLILPAVTLAIGMSARLARMIRSTLLEVLGMDYIRTARSKGVRERVVIYRHALRNALIPVVTMLGLTMAYLLSGVIVIENVFSWPGLGSYALQAINSRDYPVIAGMVFFSSAILVGANIVVDILYAFLDPRIQYS